MPGGIDDYKRKRDFEKTPEPAPGDGAPRDGEPVFVVHRHAARRLHWDLRIEVEGALSSWAVPKGFSYDPTEKRLAVRTEDHPIEYEHFSGLIPKGQYGAGSMTIWDHGRFRLAHGEDPKTEIDAGELKVIFFGRKLRGEWHLVRTKQDEGKNWLLFKSRDRYAGSRRDTALGIDLAEAGARALPRSARAMAVGARAEPFSDPDWLFEMEFEGLRAQVVKAGDALRWRGLPKHAGRAQARRLLASIESELLELRARDAWLDGVLVALDAGERPSRVQLDALLTGDAGGGLCFYAFDLLFYDEFDLRPLSTLDRKTALRAIVPTLTSVLFVDHVAGSGEELVQVVESAGLPGVIAKRVDAPYRPGASKAWTRIPASGAGEAELGVRDALAASGGDTPRTRSRVKFTNLEKVFWPAAGYTKGDLVAHYEGVADFLLPYLRDRPVHLNRFPDGIEGKSFYQRQVKEGMPEWIDTVVIESGSKEESQLQMVCNQRDTLRYLAQYGTIDLHPWLSRQGSLDCPDFAVLDLDPKDAPFVHVVKIARVTGRILDEIGLRSYLKTSGKTGLHIFVPLEAGYTYDHSRMFCEGVARAVVRELPEIATVARDPGSRGGKVYVDFLQNRRSQTVVPPYVLRPVPGATVSTPLEWSELDEELTPAPFHIRTILPRIERVGDLFAAALTDRQSLLPAIEALEALMRG